MLDLTVVDVEDDTLIVTDNSGTHYRLVLDDATRRQIRRTGASASATHKVSPRQIQAHIRAGLSAQEVADTTGAALEYVERFEGPIIAEREHIVSLALASPLAGGLGPADESAQFGTVIRSRFDSLGAHSERWASWREADGAWFVKVEFNAEGIDHDARWTFDVQRRTLEPVNAEAISLSSPEEPSDGLMPRLRAVAAPAQTDATHFDSGAFVYAEDAEQPADESPKPTRVNNNSIHISAITRSPDTRDDYQDTAELLEALRRRRGQRAQVPAPDEEAEPKTEAEANPPHLIDLPLESLGEDDLRAPEPLHRSRASDEAAQHPSHEHPSSQRPPQERTNTAKKGRASVPSWDEIVFGARGDDDA